jgi:cytochrome c peroxidase
MIARASQHPLSPAAARGWALFVSDRTACAQCHQGFNYTDEAFHNIGIGMDRPNPDPGRFKVTGVPRDRGAFKTPTLRNVARTSPYMHDGRFNSLAEVVQYYVRGGYGNPTLSPLVRPLDLNAQEQADLAAFLEALSSPLPHAAMGRLPR